MGQEQDLQRIAHLADKAAEVAARGNAAGLSLLLAEMKALCSVMPGQLMRGGDPTETAAQEARARAEDAETEARFDNMPI